MNYILALESDAFTELIVKAIEKDAEDKLWNKWLHNGMEMSFDEYMERHKPHQKKKDNEIKRSYFILE